MGWYAVVPVKRLELAKSRLRGALPGVPHEGLVLALVRDTLAAARACPAVAGIVVVTGDERVAAAAAEFGAATLPDPARGLNAAFRAGAQAARALHAVPGAWSASDAGGGGGAADGGVDGIVGLTGDLAALRPADLAAALDAAGRVAGRSFVADTAGTGTTLLAAPQGVPFAPRFGADSAAAHRAGGAVALTGQWPGLRLDVDTAADLAAAARLGLGRHGRTLLPRAGYPADHAGDGGQLRPGDAVRRGVPR